MSDEQTVTVESITQQVQAAVAELCDAAQLPVGSLFVIGCSSSEITGNAIGCAPSPVVGKAVFDAAQSVLAPRGIFLVAQCCEHLNRALVVERAGLVNQPFSEQVNARPVAAAGGSFATAAYEGFQDPVLVETIQADAGLDIGSTLIGMHLRRVASPVRLHNRIIGKTYAVAARCRPKYIGGSRTQYDDTLAHTPKCPSKAHRVSQPEK
ncbi:MAG: TIGR01440 family protein [Lawsonella sp.]|nr:TIGR01440 family protein [Mycobacteriales bacterium]